MPTPTPSGNGGPDAEGQVTRVASRVVYQNPWLRVREDDVEWPGGLRDIYSIVEKPDFAVVLPWERGGFWLVQQYRYPLGRRTWEFPMGAWPPGAVPGDAEALARAELAEETGLQAGSWEHLGRVDAAHGYSPHAFDVFLAQDLEPGRPEREETEADMVHRFVPEAELFAMVDDGRLADAASLSALLLWQRRQVHRLLPGVIRQDDRHG